jgi:hypothetical protein
MNEAYRRILRRRPLSVRGSRLVSWSRYFADGRGISSGLDAYGARRNPCHLLINGPSSLATYTRRTYADRPTIPSLIIGNDTTNGIFAGLS